MDLGTIPFIKARWFTATDGRRIDLVVIHDMETDETLTAAEAVAKYFASTANKVSAHFCVDTDSMVRCVQDKDVAYAAPGANSNGLHIELAGRASQRREDWLDPYSNAELMLAANLTRALCEKHNIPKRFVNAEALKAKARGITTHWEVSKAFRQSTHTDPGAGFPMDNFVARVIDADPAPPAPQEGGPAVANSPFAAILVHPPTGGYLEIGEDGGVFNYGGAPFFGSLGNVALNQPIVAAEWAPDYQGYYLLGRDGGIFAFGSAKHQGNALWGG